MTPTKEELVELIGMAELLEVKLREMGKFGSGDSAEYIAWSLRDDLDKICGQEYLETLRNPENGNGNN